MFLDGKRHRWCCRKCASVYSTVNYWFAEFRSSRTNAKDAPGLGSPQKNSFVVCISYVRKTYNVFYKWKNFAYAGCCAFWTSIKKTSVFDIQNSIWHWSNPIRTNFNVDLWQWIHVRVQSEVRWMVVNRWKLSKTLKHITVSRQSF